MLTFRGSRRMRSVRRSLLHWLALSPLMVVILIPYAVMLSTALKGADEVFSFTPRWIPHRIVFSSFPAIWQQANLGRALVNSLLVSVGATIVTLVPSIPAAYATARMRFRGEGTFRQFLLVTQMISPVVLIIGIFRLIRMMGLVDDLLSLVLTYAAFNAAFAIWMLQSYFRTIPLEVEEAAWIDGARWLTALRLVFLPLALPAIGVAAMFTFINAWTDFVLAFTLLRSPDQLTVTMKIFLQVSGAYHVSWNNVMAGVLIATLPAAIMFAALQRYLVRGLAIGAVK
jgi:multiple sugar transport system permease protein